MAKMRGMGDGHSCDYPTPSQPKGASQKPVAHNPAKLKKAQVGGSQKRK